MKMKICIIGLGPFGKLLVSILSPKADIFCVDKDPIDASCFISCCLLDDIDTIKDVPFDIILFSVSIKSLEIVLKSCPKCLLSGKLIIDVCSVKGYPKSLLSGALPVDSDICCTHPLFGPRSATDGLHGKVFIYDPVRIVDNDRLAEFLGIWRSLGCQILEMDCDTHDRQSAESQFMAHLVGRTLSECDLHDTIVDTPSYTSLRHFKDNMCQDSSDLFSGMYIFNSFAPAQISRMRAALDGVEAQLLAAAREHMDQLNDI